MLSAAAGMLPCAEDLGAVPEAVPRVLSELGVLGLTVPRWSRKWDLPGQPFVKLHDYREESVCAPSVHDSSTMREWWEHEDGREGLWRAIGEDGDAPSEYSPRVAARVYGAFAKCSSRLLVFQLQDLLALDESLVDPTPSNERMNVPGTNTEFNWTWRLPVPIAELAEHSDLSAATRSITAEREGRP